MDALKDDSLLKRSCDEPTARARCRYPWNPCGFNLHMAKGYRAGSRGAGGMGGLRTMEKRLAIQQWLVLQE